MSTGEFPSIAGDDVRIDAERVGQRMHLRIRPANVPAGSSNGPRVALELSAGSARALATVLHAFADDCDAAAANVVSMEARRHG